MKKNMNFLIIIKKTTEKHIHIYDFNIDLMYKYIFSITIKHLLFSFPFCFFLYFF